LVTIEGDRILAHSSVLTARSEALQAALQCQRYPEFPSSLADADTPSTSELVLPVPRDVLHHLLLFLYGTDDLAGLHDMELRLLVATAEQFSLPRLVRLCEVQMIRRLSLENVLLFLGASVVVNLEELKVSLL
jgi:hypothetical protein